MIYVVLAIVLLILLAVVIDVFQNRHPLSQEEIARPAAKRRRNRQLEEFQFCVQPRPASPDEKKAMKSTGQFVACDLDYHEAPSRIAGLLKYKKHEWIVFAFIARKRVVRLWWNKGPDGTCVWSLLPNATLRTLVTTLGVEAIAVLHNHPNPNPSRFRMNSPSDADLNHAAHFHRMLAAMGGSLLEFICERGTPHLYYAAFAEAIVPMGPVLAEAASANDQGAFPDYWLRKELSRTSLGDVVPGKSLPLQDANSASCRFPDEAQSEPTDPHDAAFYYARVTARLRDNDIVNALKDFNTAMSLDTDFTFRYWDGARSWLDKQDYLGHIAKETRKHDEAVL